MENKVIKSETFSYYSLISIGTLFGLTFFIGGLMNLLDPNGTINVKGVTEKSNLLNSAPFILFGLVAMVGSAYYWFNLGLAQISNASIKLKFFRKNVKVSLSNINFAEVTSFINGYAIKLHLNDGSSMKVQPDLVKFNFSDLTNLKRSCYRTEMWQYLKENKVKLIEE